MPIRKFRSLWNVAIIISPHGCSSSATRVIQGAMREHGKLILSLTVGELATLLVGKDEDLIPMHSCLIVSMTF